MTATVHLENLNISIIRHTVVNGNLNSVNVSIRKQSYVEKEG